MAMPRKQTLAMPRKTSKKDRDAKVARRRASAKQKSAADSSKPKKSKKKKKKTVSASTPTSTRKSKRTTPRKKRQRIAIEPREDALPFSPPPAQVGVIQEMEDSRTMTTSREATQSRVRRLVRTTTSIKVIEHANGERTEIKEAREEEFTEVYSESLRQEITRVSRALHTHTSKYNDAITSIRDRCMKRFAGDNDSKEELREWTVDSASAHMLLMPAIGVASALTVTGYGQSIIAGCAMQHFMFPDFHPDGLALPEAQSGLIRACWGTYGARLLELVLDHNEQTPFVIGGQRKGNAGIIALVQSVDGDRQEHTRIAWALTVLAQSGLLGLNACHQVCVMPTVRKLYCEAVKLAGPGATSWHVLTQSPALCIVRALLSATKRWNKRIMIPALHETADAWTPDLKNVVLSLGLDRSRRATAAVGMSLQNMLLKPSLRDEDYDRVRTWSPLEIKTQRPKRWVYPQLKGAVRRQMVDTLTQFAPWFPTKSSRGDIAWTTCVPFPEQLPNLRVPTGTVLCLPSLRANDLFVDRVHGAEHALYRGLFESGRFRQPTRDVVQRLFGECLDDRKGPAAVKTYTDSLPCPVETFPVGSDPIQDRTGMIVNARHGQDAIVVGDFAVLFKDLPCVLNDIRGTAEHMNIMGKLWSQQDSLKDAATKELQEVIDSRNSQLADALNDTHSQHVYSQHAKIQGALESAKPCFGWTAKPWDATRVDLDRAMRHSVPQQKLEAFYARVNAW